VHLVDNRENIGTTRNIYKSFTSSASIRIRESQIQSKDWNILATVHIPSTNLSHRIRQDFINNVNCIFEDFLKSSQSGGIPISEAPKTGSLRSRLVRLLCLSSWRGRQESQALDADEGRNASSYQTLRIRHHCECQSSERNIAFILQTTILHLDFSHAEENTAQVSKPNIVEELPSAHCYFLGFRKYCLCCDQSRFCCPYDVITWSRS